VPDEFSLDIGFGPPTSPTPGSLVNPNPMYSLPLLGFFYFNVTVEALGTQGTFENALRCLRPGGTLSSLGVYSGKLEMPYDAFAAGLGGHRIVTTLCPGGKERMRRLIRVVQSGRFDPLPLITHRFALDDIVEAYDLFSNRREGVLKVAIRP